MRGLMVGLVVWSAISLAGCGGTSTGNSDKVDEVADEVSADGQVETDAVNPCEVPCGDACCADGWKCGADEACYQCIKDVQCAAFEGCEGDRCRCTADKLCELKPCDADCPDWQHCEWGAAGMACVPDVCETACDPGYRCVDDECEAYCDKACEAWQECAWDGDAMVCVDLPCEPLCPSHQHCEQAECVANECTDISTDDCEDKECKCLTDGSCGECSGCPEPCDEGSACQLVDDEYTCVVIICEPACAVGLHCTEAKQCLPNVCDPECAEGGLCLKHNGTDADCQYTCEPECEDWQWCNLGACEDLPCVPACGEGEHCEQAACVDTVCEPACALGQACQWSDATDKASCVAIACDSPCADYEYCDDKNQCQAFVCDPVCEKEEHCGAQDIDADGTDICVPNECDTVCDPVLEFCNQDGDCKPVCDCSGAPVEPVCGLVDTGSGGAFQIFQSMCELSCALASVANCAELPVQQVCDLAGYLANPQADNTYDNVCYAACAGVDTEQIQAGECECAMTCTDAQLGDKPVCGQDCFDYQNPCEAMCAGVNVQFPHECPAGCGLCSPCDEETYLDPVCGTNGVTYLSMCDLATCNSGVEFNYPGVCVPSTCACSANPTPVCGMLPGDDLWQTFVNPCVANCLDATTYFDWTCTSCDPRPEAPVCAYNELTGWDVLPNQCIVDSYNFYTTSYAGACVCCGGAPDLIDGCCDLNVREPVCGVDGVTYANECALSCAGVAKDYEGACTCPSTWAPVCGDSVLETGKKYTYGNECIAKSIYGVTTFTAGACPLCTLACSGDDPDPVCGLDGVSYPNVCYLLKCNGDTIQLHLDDTECNDVCESCP